jgi:hypothetical protein
MWKKILEPVENQDGDWRDFWTEERPVFEANDARLK